MDEPQKAVWLPCELTEEEVLQRAKSLAERLARIDQLESQLASAKKQIGSDIDSVTAEVAKLRDMIATGTEYRNVECSVNYQWHRGRKITTRQDTGEIVSDVVISDTERQQHLFEEKKRKEEAVTDKPAGKKNGDAKSPQPTA